MSEKLGKAALVTGASRGIGAEIAKRLGEDGYNVVVNYAQGAADAETVVREIVAAGGRAIAAQADVSDPAAVAGLFDRGEEAFGGLDVLVNNAGVMKLAPIAQADDALFDHHDRDQPQGRVQRPAGSGAAGCVTGDGSSASPPASSVCTSRLRGLRRYQSGRRGDDARAGEGARGRGASQSMPSRRARSRPSCSSKANRTGTSRRLLAGPRLVGSASRRTSRGSSRSWRAPKEAGSAVRYCAPTEGCCDGRCAPGRPCHGSFERFRPHDRGRPRRRRPHRLREQFLHRIGFADLLQPVWQTPDAASFNRQNS